MLLKPKVERNNSLKNRYVVFVGMGIELVGIILTAVYVGQLLDAKYGTKGLGIAGLPMIGLAGWITHIVVLTKKIEKIEDLEANSKKN
jgi:F0F1-type ATP synthase assembly protein I